MKLTCSRRIGASSVGSTALQDADDGEHRIRQIEQQTQLRR